MMRTCLILIVSLAFVASCGPKRDGEGLSQPAGDADFDIQGHRGARGLMPENSIPAFERALELGVRTLELDVVIAADSEVVVSHEPWFSSAICRQPDGSAIQESEERAHNIYEMDYDEIVRYDCGSSGNVNFPEQQTQAIFKPRLDSVLAFSEEYVARSNRTPVHYNIEIKSRPSHDGIFHPPPEEFVKLVHDVIERNGVQDRTIIQSFDPRALQEIGLLDPSIALALLVDNDDGLEANLERLGFRPAVYSPHHRLVDRGLVEECLELGMKIIPWTVNEVDEMNRLRTLGVDGLITDYPDRLIQIVGAESAMGEEPFRTSPQPDQ